MRVLVLGHNGMLGSDVMKVFGGDDLHGLSIEDVDITDYDDIKSNIAEIAPGLIINCAAYTDVDGCESNKETAFAVNATGVDNIAKICSESGIKLVHISTDYVFDGNKDSTYCEDDETAPFSVYGQSKLAGEKFVKENLDEFLIIRTEWLFGKSGKNFVTTMLRLADTLPELNVVNDQFGSPTYTKDLADAIKVLVDKNLCGTYHVSNCDFTSWHGFAVKIFEYLKKNIKINEIASDKLTRPAKRPVCSIFNLQKFYSDTDIRMPKWDDALKRYLNEIDLL